MHQPLLTPYNKIFYNEWKLNTKRTDYNIVFDQNLTGNINIIKLANAIERLISEYIVLNSHIEDQGGQLYWVPNNKKYGLEYYEEQLNDEKILNYIQRPFNLHTGPLYRFCLIKIDNFTYRIIIVLYHIVIDGLSGDYFLSELSKYYNDSSYKNPYSLNEQTKLMDWLSKKLSKQIELNKRNSKFFWEKALVNSDSLNLSFLANTNNRSNYSNVPTNSYIVSNIQQLSGIGEIRFNFKKEELIKLNILKRKLLITPYLYGQAISALLLYRYTKQANFCINYPIAIKQGAEFMYGANINTILMPYNLSEVNNVIDIITFIKKFIQSLKCDNLNHCYLPITDIMSVTNRNLLNFSFIQTNLKDKLLEFGSIIARVNDTNIDLSTSLLFEQEIRNETIQYRVKYNIKSIEPFLINQFVNSFKLLFIEILNELLSVENTKLLSKIQDYPLLSRSQFYQIVKTSEGPKNKKFDTKATIHYLFEKQAQKTPNNIAIVYKNKHITYKELNEKANQLASYLQKNYKINYNTVVGLCLDRDELLIITILSIWKSGATFIILNPLDPVNRIANIIKSINTKLILANAIYNEKLKKVQNLTWNILKSKNEKLKINTLLIDSKEFCKHLSLHFPKNTNMITTNLDIAYIGYKFKEVGQYYGVMVEHRGIINLVFNLINKYNFRMQNNEEKILQPIDYTADTIVESLTLALLNGYVLVLLPNNFWLNQEAFYNYIVINKITHITATSYFLQQYNFNKVSSLKRIIVSIEQLNDKQYETLKKRIYPRTKIINVYGTVETSIISTVNIINNDYYLSMGKPINNTNIYILDDNLIPLPTGVIGNLYINGIGVARGYIDSPELTAEKFIPNPFSPKLGSRLFKTENIARRLTNGHLEYGEQKNSYIEIRGHKIELKEIEKILSSHKKIKQSAVIIKCVKVTDEILENNELLIGYYSSKTKLDDHKILSYLKKMLPEYMLPNKLIFLKDFPLTPDGNIDRKMLADFKIISNLGSRLQLKDTISKLWKDMSKVHNNLK